MDVDTLAAAAGISVDRAQIWFPYLDEAMPAFDITTPKRQAAFVAQTSHETGGYSRWIENLNYSTPERIFLIFRSSFPSVNDARPYVRSPEALANRVYSSKGGNGPAWSGDGWRYRGRGLIQITFKNGYQACAEGLGINCVVAPEILEDPYYAVRSAAWWWSAHELNDYADRGEFDHISGIINRGSPHKVAAGAAERLAMTETALQVLA